jgi:hypothetical protein
MDKTLRQALGHLAIAAVFGAGWWASATAQVVQPPGQGPNVISGPNVGFRVERTIGGVPEGRLVVLVDGRWVEPTFSTGVRLLTK